MKHKKKKLIQEQNFNQKGLEGKQFLNLLSTLCSKCIVSFAPERVEKESLSTMV
jgi:hypothetical protein